MSYAELLGSKTQVRCIRMSPFVSKESNECVMQGRLVLLTEPAWSHSNGCNTNIRRNFIISAVFEVALFHYCFFFILFDTVDGLYWKGKEILGPSHNLEQASL